MSLQFGQIILFTHHKERLASFLSEFFECEMKAVGDGVFLQHEGANFLIVESKEKFDLNSGCQTVLDFFVENYEELVALKQRLEFLTYRLNEETIAHSVNIVKLDHKSYLLVKDPDGRSWKFSAKN